MNTFKKNIFPEWTKKSGTIEILEEELLDVLLDGDDLRLDLASLVLGDAGSDHRPRHATSPAVKNTHTTRILQIQHSAQEKQDYAVEPAKSLLGADKDIGDVLVLAEQRDVEENLERLAVRRQHDKLRLATVQGLGRLVGTLKIATE